MRRRLLPLLPSSSSAGCHPAGWLAVLHNSAHPPPILQFCPISSTCLATYAFCSCTYKLTATCIPLSSAPPKSLPFSFLARLGRMAVGLPVALPSGHCNLASPPAFFPLPATAPGAAVPATHIEPRACTAACMHAKPLQLLSQSLLFVCLFVSHAVQQKSVNHQLGHATARGAQGGRKSWGSGKSGGGNEV